MTLYLVDASPYIFRAYFSLPSSMVSPAGERVGAVYGFAGFLLKLIEEERPSHLALAFDGSLTTSFRNELYPAYKAQRELPPPELEAQLAACRELGEAIGAATFIDARYEADDLIATLLERTADGRRARSELPSAVIVTSDKDLAQLVDAGTTLLDYAKGDRYGPSEVREKFGVESGQIPDYLGLAGDSVDNIPGVAGIGAKTAAALLSERRDLEAIYGDLGGIAELPLRGARSIAAKLEAQRDTAFLSRELATVSKEAPIEAGLADLAYRGPDLEAARTLCEQLGFERLLGRIEKMAHLD